ncbi:copper resistance CopC/CopD family protein [Staphylococcus chromogenes]|uniref:copper resistance CopC/CopD family protein n=1 Tax=Staphylococcus chromogenes TaxID=46126 RepID=UPI002DB7AC27|nr:copper resistance protein CopC [Staphylococcus chromogenes]MEB7825014.1 copper resistance protein CopC/CopD [Staphylococcus chromogenes]
MKHFQMYIKGLIFMFMLVFGIGGQFNVASAHASLEHAEPSEKAVVASSPKEIKLEMSEPVNTTYTHLTLYNDRGKEIKAIQPNEKNFSKVVTFSTEELQEGTYLVEWETVAQDGHDMKGHYLFSVGHETASSIEPTSSLLTDTTFWWGAMRFVLQSLLLVLVGFHAVNRLMERQELPTYSIKSRAMTWILFMVALATGILYLMTLPQQVINEILMLNFSTWKQFPFIISIVALMTLIILYALRNMEKIWFDVMPILIIIAMAISGHVWAQTYPIYSILIRSLHLFAIALWLGSLVYLVFYIFARHRHSYVLILKDILFKLNVTAVTTIILTGLLMTLDLTSLPRLLSHFSTYSGLWYTKLIVTFVMMALGGFQTFKVMKNKKSIHGPLLYIELGLGILLILVGVVMSQIEIL